MTTWTDSIPKDRLVEDGAAPAPWEYVADESIIIDNNGDVVCAGVPKLIGERIVRAVNIVATGDGILS
jgi:hypothetical protein